MKPFRASSIPVKHKAFSLLSPTIVDLRSKPIRRMQLLSASATAFTDEDEEDEDGADDDFDFFPTQKTKVQKDEEEDDDDDDDDDFFPTQKTKVQKITPSICKRNTYKCDGKSVSVSRF